MRINQLVTMAYETAKAKGWHDEKREFGTLVALMHSELSEALEADRKHMGQDAVVEELADVCIRIFDACGLYGFDLETAIIQKMEKNTGREFKHGGKKY